MPAAPANLGMNTRWFPEVLKTAAWKDLKAGISAVVVSPPLFLATKIEDIITLVDGCASIPEIDGYRNAGHATQDHFYHGH